MSLINDVLRDLDRRHANAADRAGLPNDVRPLPPQATSWRVSTLAFWVAAACVAVGGGWWALQQDDSASVARVSVPDAVTSPVSSATVSAPVTRPMAPVASPTAVPQPLIFAAPPASPSVAEKSALATHKLSPAPNSPPVVSPAKKTGEPVTPGPALKLSPDIKLPDVERAATPATDDWVKAQTLLKNGRLDEAEPVLRQILATQPALLAPRQALLSILLPARRYADALPVLKAGLVQHPDQTTWAMNLARLQVDANNYPAAWDALSVSLPHAQQQPEYLAFAGTVLQRLDRPVEAVSQYQAALRLRPEEPRWWVGLGIALEAASHPSEARVAFQRAKALGNVSPDMAKFIEQKLQ